METQTAKSNGKSRTRSRARVAAAPAQSKTDQALAIFNKMHAKSSRKEVLDAFVEKVGLTASSASTYYQKFLTNGGKAPSKSGTSGRGRRPDESSKAGIARAIFRKLAKKPRKDVLAAFISDAGLTPAGASTYYQKMKHAA